MTRPSLLIPALAVAALLAATPVAAAPTADPEPVADVSVKFALTASNGIHARLEAFGGEATLEFVRKGRSVSYNVPAKITEAGLKAQFGELGQIDLAFEPTETLNIREPPKRCEGEPSISLKGLLVGTFEFAGERGFVRIDAGRTEGKMFISQEAHWRCTDPSRRVDAQRSPRPSAVDAREGVEPEPDPGTLAGIDRDCRCYFLALAEQISRRGRTGFLGAKVEDREGMEITRETRAIAGASAFVYDHAAGTASVHPPQPFSGDGTFKRRPHGRDLWRSTIRVPFLGSAPVSVRGRGFRITLLRGFPGD